MPDVGRRRFLDVAGGSAALSALTPPIARAASIPASTARATGRLSATARRHLQFKRAFAGRVDIWRATTSDPQLGR
jgi:hypothetical protein